MAHVYRGLFMTKNKELENYFKVVDKRQNIIVFSNDETLRTKDVKKIVEFLKEYGNDVDSFIMCSSKFDFSKNLLDCFRLDVSEKDMRCGRSKTSLSQLIGGCYEPIVIMAHDYHNDIDQVAQLILGQNAMSTIILVGSKNRESDLQMREMAKGTDFDYVPSGVGVTSSIIETITRRRIKDFKEPVHTTDVVVKVLTDKK